MSTSILYHAFGIKGVKHSRTRFEGGEIIFEAHMTRRLARCEQCNGRRVVYKGTKVRRLRMVPIGGRPVWLALTVHRLACKACGAYRWPPLPFADRRRSYTHAFERLVVELLRHMTIRACAHCLRVGWDLIKDIHKRVLSRQYRHMPLKDVEAIAIDEFSIRKGHVYMTAVLDLRQGRILHVVPGKAGQDIAPFLRVLARKAPRLKAVAVDLNEGYIGAVRCHLPGVAIVLDHYHISALVNRAIDECRRGQQAELDRLGKQTLKGARFLLLRNYEDLPDRKRARLRELLSINHPLLVMHTMKEQLRAFWAFPTASEAASFLAAWCRDAMNSGIRPLMRVGKTLALYRTLLLNYFTHPISCGRIEGIINKIKTLKRQAYGFRDESYFALRLYHLHEQRYSLAG